MTKQRLRMLMGLTAVASLTLVTVAPADRRCGQYWIGCRRGQDRVAVPGDLPQRGRPVLPCRRDVGQ